MRKIFSAESSQNLSSFLLSSTGLMSTLIFIILLVSAGGNLLIFSVFCNWAAGIYDGRKQLLFSTTQFKNKSL
jgi:hypothetical protein